MEQVIDGTSGDQAFHCLSQSFDAGMKGTKTITLNTEKRGSNVTSIITPMSVTKLTSKIYRHKVSPTVAAPNGRYAPAKNRGP